MTEVQIVHPKIIERQKNPMKHIRDDAARIIIDVLSGFKKKIPKKGLNNKVPMWRWKATDYPGIYPFGRNEPIPELPTLPRRMERLFWHTLYLPPQMVALGITSDEFDRDLARSLMIDCLELLSDLFINLYSFTVVEKSKVENYKKTIWDKKKYLLVTARVLGMVQYAEISEQSHVMTKDGADFTNIPEKEGSDG